MEAERSIIKQAIALVEQEQTCLCAERCAFEAFRETVRLTTPDSTDATGPSETTQRLLAAYREEVMDALDYEEVYGDTLAESLEQELASSNADLLLSKSPLTQKRKRNLLLSVAAAIENREQLRSELEEERAALATFDEELTEVEAVINRLPPCSPRNQHIEKLLVIWEVYETLAERCEELLERRQQQIQDAERFDKILSKKHARNDYLYQELDTRYPVLSAITTTIERIDSKRNGEEPPESPDGALQC